LGRPMKMMNWTQKAQDRDVWKKPISSSGETTVYEEEDINNVGNYRPISILSPLTIIFL